MQGEPAFSSIQPTPDTGVLLLQLGGPTTSEEVRPFIRKMLSDPAIVEMPALLRIPLAHLISFIRAPRVRKQYKAIGGGSPITRIGFAQAARLAEALNALGRSMPVLLGQRYTPPLIPEALRQASQMGLSRLVVVPLYPHFSFTTTGSALREVEHTVPKIGIKVLIIKDYADNSSFISALADNIRDALSSLSGPNRKEVCVIFSAHSLPMRYVESGDPYPERITATVHRVMARLGGGHFEFKVSYQSKIGPVRWLGPSTQDAIREAAREGKKAVVIVPVSFVSDHIETLYEIDILYRNLAYELGIPEFVRVKSFNDSRTFATAMAQIVVRALEEGAWLGPEVHGLVGWP